LANNLFLISFGTPIGDVLGSVSEGVNAVARKNPNLSITERNKTKSYDFELLPEGSRFTDDTILAAATMAAICEDYDNPRYTDYYREFFLLYPNSGFGGGFKTWANSGSNEPNDSWGNGAAMRVGPIGLVYPTLSSTLEQAAKSASITHAHPEGIRGAKAIAGAVYLARTGETKDRIRQWVTDEIGYDLNFKINDVKESYTFDVSCAGSVPHAIVAFLDSTSYIDAIRLAISLGGDSDTIAAITSSICEPFYGFDVELYQPVYDIIKQDKFILGVIENFDRRFNKK
jgi:ADP-ribosylglycohydrolase